MRPAGEPLTVWAPFAEQVVAEVSGTSMAMVAVGNGWWRSEQAVPFGSDYAFRLDGGPPRPDPRSPWQPGGVHGPSRAFDPRAHEWADAAWRGRDARGAVGYELHVGTFTPEGTLDAAIARLPYLAELGIELVESMPLAAFNGEHGWGYDGVALYAVHQPYGGPAALQRFVDAAHGHGIAVCLDVVYNHLGPSGNYLAEFGPYFTDTHTTPWGAAVNLDAEGCGPVRSFLVENALRWLRDFHLDALRLDAVHALVDQSPRHLLAELSARVDELAAELGRPLSLIAESDLNDPAMVTPVASGGMGMHAQWADDVHHAIHALLTGERQGYYVDFGSPQTLAHALTQVFVHDGGRSTFRGSDWGAPVPAEIGGHAFVVFSANHDQVGNRAVGDRPSATLSAAQLAQSAALVLCSPFTPMIFMGEEWGATTPFRFFTDHPEPELAAAVTTGRREEFASHGWDAEDVPDPQDPASFAGSRLDWDEAARPPHEALLRWHRTLLRLRAAQPALHSPDRAATTCRSADGWFALDRRDDSGGTVCLVLASDAAVEVPLPQAGAWELLAAWDDDVVCSPDAVALSPNGVAVVGLSR